MSKDAQYRKALFTAEAVIKSREISALPIDVAALAEDAGIALMPKPDTAFGVSGMLIRSGQNYGIVYATHIPNSGFQRFSIAHELGHYFLPGHTDAVLGNKDIHQSRAGFTSADPYEREADHFASGLLMPRQLFIPALRRAGEGLDAVEALSQLCNTSLIATAIRYAECTSDPVAVIVSTKLGVEFSTISRPLKLLKDASWLRRGETVPKGSVTHEMNLSPPRVARAERESGRTNLQEWLGCSQKVSAREDVVGLGAYMKTLTLLWDIELPDELESYDSPEESSLTLSF